MEIVVTLVSEPKVLTIDNNVINGAKNCLKANGAKYTSKKTLAAGEAVDLCFTDIAAPQAQALLEDCFSDQKIDICCQINRGRKKKMLVCDMDSTILSVECIDEIADAMGIKDKISAITEAAMQGQLDFSASLIERVALLKGLPEEKLEEVYKNRIHLSPGAETLVATMLKKGALTLLISGGFTYFSEKVALKLGFQHHHANILEIENGVLTGRVTMPTVDAMSKRNLLIKFRNENHIDPSLVVAVGDGANDIPMINAAELGVAYKAKPKTIEQANAAINHTGLETVLFFQGYKRAEFVLT